MRSPLLRKLQRKRPKSNFCIENTSPAYALMNSGRGRFFFMSFGNLLGKHTWLGVACTWFVFLLLTALGALLTVKGYLPVPACSVWVPATFGVAVFVGGRFAAKGREAPLPRAVLTALLSLGLAWLIGLATGKPLSFSENGFAMAIAALSGGLLSGIMGRGRGKKRRSAERSKHANRQKKR